MSSQNPTVFSLVFGWNPVASMQVKKIAIIGGGPSGLVALNEFLHTGEDGRSTIDSTDHNKVKLPEKCAFEEIVVFEQSPKVGGVWNYCQESDPYFPKSKEYSVPQNVRSAIQTPEGEKLREASVEHPYTPETESDGIGNNERWCRGGVYKDLFTNIPNRLMHFSSCFDYDVPNTDEKSNLYYPFVKHQQVLEYVDFFATAYDLKKYVRYNTSVEKVCKIDGKWHVTVVKIDEQTKTEMWYTETFDAVVVAVGRFNVPFFPKIENMYTFVQEHPGVISHAKSFRTVDGLKNKKILLVGTNISSVDLLQYFIPTCKEVWLSSNSFNLENDYKNPPKNWIENIMRDQSLNFHKAPRIRKFDGDSVEFEDGTIVSNFDRIIFATGYHLYFPFLDTPENEDKEYIKLASGRDDLENYAKTKVDNLYMYTFSVGDPTLCHLGIQHTPLFFLAAEVNSIAIAGIWSGTKKLPSKEEQIEWCKKRFKGKTKGFQFVGENDIPAYFKKLYEYSPQNRLDIVNLLQPNEISNSKLVLNRLFYEIAQNT